jgi:hypothetical protein
MNRYMFLFYIYILTVSGPFALTTHSPWVRSNRVEKVFFVFLEMGLYRSRIEFLVMFEVVQHCL